MNNDTSQFVRPEAYWVLSILGKDDPSIEELLNVTDTINRGQEKCEEIMSLYDMIVAENGGIVPEDIFDEIESRRP